MAWTDKYRQASFRGVRFEVRDHGAQAAGRRVKTHEYPGRDEPFSEDLGRKVKRFDVNAFLLGDDYMERRDALLDACDQPGPGTLVHPYLGQLAVTCEGAHLSETTAEGRMCRLRLSFVEAGRNQYPSDDPDSSIRVLEAAEAARGAVIEQFQEAYGL